MAYPMKLLPETNVLGSNDFERQTILLNASASNSQTKYRAGDKVIFQIPAYRASFIDWARTFLQMKVRTSLNQVRVCDGLPVFKRMVVSFGGVVIEDVSQYATLEKIHKLVHETKADQEGKYMYGDFGFASIGSNEATAGVGQIQTNAIVSTMQSSVNGTGEVYMKKLISGVLGQDGYYFPIHRLNGGSMLQIELELANDLDACCHTAVAGSTTVGAAPSTADYWYELSEIKMQLEILKVSDEYFKKFNEVANSKELVLPITTFKHHIATFGKDQTDAVVYINSNSKNLKRVYTTFQDALTASTEEHFKPSFKCGAGDSARLKRYQYRYMNKNFPTSGPVETGDGLQTVLANAVTNSRDTMTKDLPLMCSYNRFLDYKPLFQTHPVIIQNFSYDSTLVSGLNINAASTPLILEVSFDASGGSGNRNVISFTENSMDLVLDQSGNASIVQKRPAMSTE